MKEFKDKNKGGKNMFISFEGIDGCGKSTQVELFLEYLKKEGFEYVKVREPGGTELGEEIRNLLIKKDMCPRSELLLFLASRAQLVEEVIKPALYSGKIVVADRFAHSSIAYQGCGRNLGVKIVQLLNDFSTAEVYPNVVFYIDIKAETAINRMENSRKNYKDRIEREKLNFWKSVRNCYLEMARQDKKIIIINGEQTIEKVHKEIVNHFRNVISTIR